MVWKCTIAACAVERIQYLQQIQYQLLPATAWSVTTYKTYFYVYVKMPAIWRTVVCAGCGVCSASLCSALSGMNLYSTTLTSILGGLIFSAGWWRCPPFSVCQFWHWPAFYWRQALLERSVGLAGALLSGTTAGVWSMLKWISLKTIHR